MAEMGKPFHASLCFPPLVFLSVKNKCSPSEDVLLNVFSSAKDAQQLQQLHLEACEFREYCWCWFLEKILSFIP